MRADADGSGPRRLTNVPGYDGGPFFSPDGKRIVWRRFDEAGPDCRRLDDEPRWHRPAADHRLRGDELGAVHPPVRRVHHLRVEQARVRELRAVPRRHRRHEGAGPRDLHRRLRRPARAVAGRHGSWRGRRTAAAAAKDRSTWRSGIIEAALDGAEGRAGPRSGNHERTTHAARHDDATRSFVWRCCSSPRTVPSPRRSPTRVAARARTSRRWRRSSFGGREAGSEGERLAGRLHRRAARADRRAAAAGPHATCSRRSSSPPAAATAARSVIVAAQSGTAAIVTGRRRRSARSRSPTMREVTGDGGLRRLRHRRPRVAELRLRQLRRPRRQGQDRRRPPLLPGGRRPADEGDPRALFGPSLQGDGRAAARREGDARRHRPALAQRRRDWCR